MGSVPIRRGFVYLLSQNPYFLFKSRLCFSLCNSTCREKQHSLAVSELLLQNHHFHSQAISQVAFFSTSQKSDLVLSFLKGIGFSATQLEKILKSKPELLSVNPKNTIKPIIQIFQDFGISADGIVEIISKEPSILQCSPEKSKLILSFLKKSGFSATHLEKMLKLWPDLLSVNPEKTIKPKIKIFRGFGFSSHDIAEIISKEPSILRSSANNKIIPSLSLLKELLGSVCEVAKFLKFSGWYLKTDLDRTLVPNIKFMHSCGISKEKIVWLMYYFPRFLLQKTENIKQYVEKVDQLGFDRSSKMFIYAVRVVSSMNNETWELKMKAFRDLGFSEDDTLRLFRTHPVLFGTSAEKINQIKDVVLATGKYDMSCIVNCPSALTRSIEKTYKQRFKVLGILEGKNLITDWPSFSTVYRLTDEKFFEKFVSPYVDEVGDVYLARSARSDKRNVNFVPSSQRTIIESLVE